MTIVDPQKQMQHSYDSNNSEVQPSRLNRAPALAQKIVRAKIDCKQKLVTDFIMKLSAKWVLSMHLLDLQNGERYQNPPQLQLRN